MADREIKIFKTFEEQEAYQLQWMINSTPKERFSALFKMQQFSNKFHAKFPKERTITIHHGYLKQ